MSKGDPFVDLFAKAMVSRREFLKWGTLLGGAGILAKGDLSFGLKKAWALTDRDDEKIVWNFCSVNCEARCPLRLHVKGGRVVQVETDNLGEDTLWNHQVRAYLRGRSMRRRIYAPQRLKYPMKRVGKRGEGKFERISWDQAFETIASRLKAVKKTYGNEAIYLHYGTGAIGGTVSRSWPPGSTPIARLMNVYGGYLNHYGDYSAGQIETALPYTYGDAWVLGNNITDIAHARLVVLFGHNYGSLRLSGGSLCHEMQEARKRSDVKIIIIDPCYTSSVANYADQWISIRPGTDAALISSLAHVLITENLVDQKFLDRYCLGYDEEHMPQDIPRGNSYKSYILGTGRDKIAKTPKWASGITGVPEDDIVRLAREIGQAKPAYISQGWSLQRQANGENNCKAVCMLPILTGNVGIRGGNSGASETHCKLPTASFPTLSNPVKTSISFFTWTDAIERGPEMTAKADGVKEKEKLDVPIKFLWLFAGNTLAGQHADITRTTKIIEDDKKCETIVVIDNFLTASAKFADILLPGITNIEEMDMAPQHHTGKMGYVIFGSPAIKPLFESRSCYDICAGIAERLGIKKEFTQGRTHDQWVEWVYNETKKKSPVYPDFKTAFEKGIIKHKITDDPPVPYKSFRDDPDKNPLATPSGKIEIFSPKIWEIANTWQLAKGDVITALPEYTAVKEGAGSDLQKTYPLQLLTRHPKQRVHSCYWNVDWIQEISPQEVWINPIDAETRGIAHGDMIRLFNDRGATEVPAKVTVRIMPGVVSLPQGAWYTPGPDGTDKAGASNILTSAHPSPLAKANPSHTTLVQAEKV